MCEHYLIYKKNTICMKLSRHEYFQIYCIYQQYLDMCITVSHKYKNANHKFWRHIPLWHSWVRCHWTQTSCPESPQTSYFHLHWMRTPYRYGHGMDSPVKSKDGGVYDTSFIILCFLLILTYKNSVFCLVMEWRPGHSLEYSPAQASINLRHILSHIEYRWKNVIQAFLN